jgi:D-glycero-alpha-D-manno-heptose-7-phosphate kinase
MIVARAPVRITLAGGGTDIKSYYQRTPGFLIAAGINKYSWVMANKGYYDYIHLKYSKEEKIDAVKEISHPIFREMLLYFKCKEPIELVSMADYPIGSGLGTSGSFSVALAQCLCDYFGVKPTYKKEIAEIACHIEIDVLKDPIGKQDQYATSFGGINGYTFNKDGSVEVTPIFLDISILNGNLLLFDTQIPRKSSYVLTDQVKEMEAGGEVIKKLDEVKAMAYETKKLLETNKLDDWGFLLNDYWQLRKKFSSKVSNPLIDEAYETALKNGALGGKLQGAGGGGFLMFYCPVNKERLIGVMTKMGLKHLPFKFDFEGVKSWRMI